MGCQTLAGFRLDDNDYCYSFQSPHTATVVRLQYLILYYLRFTLTRVRTLYVDR